MENWECDRTHSAGHQIIWLRLKSGKRVFIDFTSCMYGNFSYNSKGYPFWMQNEEEQDWYKMREILTPHTVDAMIAKALQEMDTSKDVRPKIIAGCKKYIIERMIGKSSSNFQETQSLMDAITEKMEELRYQ